MNRLTTDNPNGNFETILNFVYSKDGWAHIRSDGENADVLLTDWIKRQCLARGCDELPCETPEAIDAAVTECLTEFDDDLCPMATAYAFASQACHLRDRLKRYEDILFGADGTELITLEQLTALRAQQEAENEPLTVDDLKAMPTQEWVWIEILDPAAFDRWVFIKAKSAYYRKHDGFDVEETFFCGYPAITCAFDYENYGKAWCAYTCRPPKGKP